MDPVICYDSQMDSVICYIRVYASQMDPVICVIYEYMTAKWIQ
jgi:hypothetical protein